MKVPQSVRQRYSACSNCNVNEAGERETSPAVKDDFHRRAMFTKSPMSTSYIKIGLIATLFICLVILSSVREAESRGVGRRNRNKSQPGENDITVEEDGGKASRRRARKNKILKTSEEARIITEKRYLKSDWCKSQPVKQLVRTKGCKGIFINNFCYGQCNSFYIPRELTRAAKEQEAFKSCSFCKPYKVERISVTLKCSKNRGNRGKTIKRMVNRIKECKCIAVPDIDSRTPAPVASISSTSASSASTSGESRR